MHDGGQGLMTKLPTLAELESMSGADARALIEALTDEESLLLTQQLAVEAGCDPVEWIEQLLTAR